MKDALPYHNFSFFGEASPYGALRFYFALNPSQFSLPEYTTRLDKTIA
jgi:hypothetical protein